MFLDNFLIAAENVAILYILVAVGFAADKTGLFTEKAARLCTDLMFYIITPAKIVQSFLNMEFNRESATNLVLAAVFGIVLHLISAGISFGVFNKSPVKRSAVLKYASAYGNCGYMAIPLSSAMLGNEGVFYSSVIMMTFHLFSFTHGVWMMSRSDSGEKAKFNYRNILVNPGTIALVIGLPLYLLKVNLPDIIGTPIDYLAELNTPLAMLIFGTYLANADFKSAFKEWRILCVAAIKLVMLPLVCMLVFKLCGVSGDMLVALIIAAGAPSANITVVFAAKYDKDTGLASQTVSIASLLSIITMPLMIGLATTI